MCSRVLNLFSIAFMPMLIEFNCNLNSIVSRQRGNWQQSAWQHAGRRIQSEAEVKMAGKTNDVLVGTEYSQFSIYR